MSALSTMHLTPRSITSSEDTSIEVLPINSIRRDGGTQTRLRVDPEVISDYAALMMGGTDFPPVRVWFDGLAYWLSDGFQRIQAAVQCGFEEVKAEIVAGTLDDAVWDSYGANSHHGVRRTRAEVSIIVGRALQHPRAVKLSNVQIAKHLGIPETTLRRWRARLSSPSGEDTSRLVTRRGKTYEMNTALIGKKADRRGIAKSKRELREGLVEMKRRASPEAHRILNVLTNWVFGPASAAECLRAIELIVAGCRRFRPSLINSAERTATAGTKF